MQLVSYTFLHIVEFLFLELSAEKRFKFLIFFRLAVRVRFKIVFVLNSFMLKKMNPHNSSLKF